MTKRKRTEDLRNSATSAPKPGDYSLGSLGVDPFEYLRDIFQRISTHPQNSLDDLLPDKWKLARPSPVC